MTDPSWNFVLVVFFACRDVCAFEVGWVCLDGGCQWGCATNCVDCHVLVQSLCHRGDFEVLEDEESPVPQSVLDARCVLCVWLC